MGTPIIQTPIHYNPDYSDSAKGALDFQKLSNLSQMGGCQNYGPFLDPYYNTAPNI